MTIFQTSPISLRPFRAYADPGLPAGYWVVHVGILGDASGGAAQQFLEFSRVGTSRPSQMYSLEALVIDQSINPQSEPFDSYALMEILRFDQLPAQGGTGAQFWWYGLHLKDIGGQRIGAAIQQEAGYLPIFLGAPDKQLLGSFILIEHNNFNGAIFSVKAEGYFWNPGAINAPGGPRRPIDGLYSR